MLLILVIAIAASSTAFGQKKDASSKSDSKLIAELIDLDKQWTAAELRGDKEVAGHFVADDYLETLQDGRVQNKTQYLEAVKPGTNKVAEDDYVVRIFGKMAIMTHRVTVTGERNFQYRSTHIWMERDGRWQLIAHHSGDITQ